MHAISNPLSPGNRGLRVVLSRHFCASLHVGHARSIRPVFDYRITGVEAEIKTNKQKIDLVARDVSALGLDIMTLITASVKRLGSIMSIYLLLSFIISSNCFLSASLHSERCYIFFLAGLYHSCRIQYYFLKIEFLVVLC